ncbi:MAG: DnaB family ATPase, partial [Paraclostridium sp.]
MNKNKTKDLKVNIKFDITMLDLMLKFSISKNIVILRKHLTALYKLIDMINEDRYKGDANLLSRLLFLKFILHAKLIEKYDNLQIVLDYAKSKLDNKYLELVEETVLPDMIDDLSTADVNYIIQKVNNNTKYAYLYKYVDSLGNLHDMLTDDAYNNIEDINARASNVMSMMNNDIRKVKAESLMEQDFDLLSDDVMDNLSAIIEAYKQPESILKTGYARLNELMEGGFHKGRIYCYMGSTGGFKSGLLINLLRGIKVNNDDYKTKDPEKKPMILYI